MRRRGPAFRAAWLSLAALIACGRRTEPAAEAPKAAPSAVAENAPVENADVGRRANRPAGGSAPVLWIGLDGLDFEILDRLSGQGRMPNWKRLAA